MIGLIDFISKGLRCCCVFLTLLIAIGVFFGNEELPFNYTYLYYSVQSVSFESISMYVKGSYTFVNDFITTGKREEDMETDIENNPNEVLSNIITEPLGSIDPNINDIVNKDCLYPASLDNIFSTNQWGSYKTNYKQLDLEDTILELGIYHCVLISLDNGTNSESTYRWIGKEDNTSNYVILNIVFGLDNKPTKVELIPVMY